MLDQLRIKLNKPRIPCFHLFPWFIIKHHQSACSEALIHRCCAGPLGAVMVAERPSWSPGSLQQRGWAKDQKWNERLVGGFKFQPLWKYESRFVPNHQPVWVNRCSMSQSMSIGIFRHMTDLWMLISLPDKLFGQRTHRPMVSKRVNGSNQLVEEFFSINSHKKTWA